MTLTEDTEIAGAAPAARAHAHPIMIDRASRHQARQTASKIDDPAVSTGAPRASAAHLRAAAAGWLGVLPVLADRVVLVRRPLA